MTETHIPRLARKLFDREFREKLHGWVDFHCQRLNHRKLLPKLSPVDQKIIHDLRTEGVSISNLDELSMPGTGDFLSAADLLMPKLKVGLPVKTNLLQAAAALASDAKSLEDQTQYGNMDIYAVHASPAAINSQAPVFFLFGLNSRLLNIAENHIGLPPAYIGADIRRDVNEGADAANRRWHKDPEEATFKRALKVCIYLTDVTDESVCFEYIPKCIKPDLYGTIANERMEREVPKKYWKPVLGKRGTVIFAAINEMYHHARAPVSSEGPQRISAWFSYTSRNPSNRAVCRSQFPLEALQLVEPMLSQSQKEYLFWD